MTVAKRQLKIDKGQCYNCNKPWHRGHKCKAQVSLLVLNGVLPEGCEDLDQFECQLGTTEVAGEIQELELVTGHLYALIRSPNTRCLRLQGYITGKPLQILIDGGSSHNVIQVANYLGLDITPSKIFSYCT